MYVKKIFCLLFYTLLIILGPNIVSAEPNPQPLVGNCIVYEESQPLKTQIDHELFSTVSISDTKPPNDYCVDWKVTDDPVMNLYLDTICMAPYGANKWHVKDYDGDGYEEYYLLVGEKYYQWSYARAQSGYYIYGFGDDQVSNANGYGWAATSTADNLISSPCYLQSAYSWQSRELNVPEDRLYSMPLFAYVDDSSNKIVLGYGWLSGELSWVWGDGHKEYAHVKSVDPTFTLSSSPISQTISPGESKMYTVNILKQGEFITPVKLSCSGIPTGTSYTFSKNPVTPSDTSTLTLTASSVTPPGTYVITISGEGGGDEKITTLTLTVINKPPYVPSNPTPVNGAFNQPVNDLELSWTGGDPDGDTVIYDVFLCSISDPTPTVPVYSGTSTSYSVFGLSYSTTYNWKVVSTDDNGAVVEGPLWSFGTQEPPNNPPNQPSNPVPENGSPDQAVNLELSWTGGDPDGDTVTYDVYLYSSSDPVPGVPIYSGTSNSYSVSGLSYSTTYNWKVVSTDDNGAVVEGPLWSFGTQNPPNHPPNQPSNPVPDNGSPDQAVNLELSWTGGDPDGDTVTYDVYFYSSSDPVPSVPVYSGTSSSYSVSGLSYSTTYNWKVVSTDDNGAVVEGPLWSFGTQEQPLFVYRNFSTKSLAPGETFNVTVTIEANQKITPFILNESIPEGWIAERGKDDADIFKNLGDGFVKWVWISELYEGEFKIVEYSVKSPLEAKTGIFSFNGTVSTKEIETIYVEGDEDITIVPFSIEEYFPLVEPISIKGETKDFSIKISSFCNVTWLIDNNVVKRENLVNSSYYEVCKDESGNYNVTAVVEKDNVQIQKVWNWTVINWNPWNDEKSEGGVLITTTELQEAIYCWLNNVPLPEGAELTTERLQEVISEWLSS